MDAGGRIYSPEAVDALKAKADAGDEAAKKTVKALVGLDDEQLAFVSRMNRAQRRAWYSDYRRALKRKGA